MKEELKTLYLAGRFYQRIDGVIRLDLPVMAWDLLGIFETEEKAFGVCTEDKDFIGRIKLNDDSDMDKRFEMDAYYPNLEERPESWE